VCIRCRIHAVRLSDLVLFSLIDDWRIDRRDSPCHDEVPTKCRCRDYKWFLLRDARSAKSGIAIVCRPSIRLSVRPFVTLIYRGRIGWTTSKLITRIISLGLRTSEPYIDNLVQEEHPLNLGEMETENPQYPETGQDMTKVTIDDYRKSHTRFRFVPKSTTLMDDLEGPLCALFQNICVFQSPPRKFEWRQTYTISIKDV